MFDALPNLHAVLVHFPIGLLGTAVVADIAALAGPTQMIFRSRITLLYVAGTACLAATYLAGRAAAMYVYTPGMAHSVVLNHWNLALGRDDVLRDAHGGAPLRRAAQPTHRVESPGSVRRRRSSGSRRTARRGRPRGPACLPLGCGCRGPVIDAIPITTDGYP